MAKKLGRPPLPIGQSKSRLYNLRATSDELRDLAAISEEENKPATTILRQRGMPALIWVRTKWSVADLHDKKIRCPLSLTTGLFEVTGILKARQRPTGEVSVRLHLIEDMGSGAYRVSEFHFRQDQVDRIERADPKDGVDFKIPLPQSV